MYRHSTKVPLQEMPGASLSGVDASGKSAVHLRKRAAPRIRVLGHQNRMNMVGHQPPRPHRYPVRGARHSEETALSGIVVGLKRTLLPPIAAYCHAASLGTPVQEEHSGHDEPLHDPSGTSDNCQFSRPIL